MLRRIGQSRIILCRGVNCEIEVKDAMASLSVRHSTYDILKEP